MKLNIKKCAFLFCIIINSCYGENIRLKTIKIYEDSPMMDKHGYGMCDMAVNGETNLIKKVLRPSDVVFDLGANIGEWSRAALKAQAGVKIYAFEPIPETFDELQTRLNSENVKIYNVALDKEIGSKNFYIYITASGSNGCSSLYFRPANSLLLKSNITVPTITLDSFCTESNIEKINFLKIDTEGNEFNILLGAQKMLKNKEIDLIQFEYGGTYPDAGTTLKEVYDFLTALGYSIYRIVPNGLIKIPSWRSELETNNYSNYLAALD